MTKTNRIHFQSMRDLPFALIALTALASAQGAWAECTVKMVEGKPAYSEGCTDKDKETLKGTGGQKNSQNASSGSGLKKDVSEKISTGDQKGTGGVYGKDIDDTDNQIQTGNIVNQVSTIGAQVTTSVQGQLATQKAATEGTQSAAVKGAAGMSKNTGMMNMMIGAANLWYAWQHKDRMGEHDTNNEQLSENFVKNKASKEIEAEMATANGSHIYNSNKAYARELNAQLEPLRQARDNCLAQASGNNCDEAKKAYEAKAAEIDNLARTTAMDAIKEQTTAREEAKKAMAESLIRGSVGMLNGAAAIATGNQMELAASKLQAMNSGNMPTYTPGQLAGAGDPLGGGTTTITGNGTTTPAAGAASGDTAANNDGGGLGDPYAQQQPGAAPSNTPDVKMTAAGPGGGGGGGGGGMGGANTSPSTGAADGEQQPRMADNGRGAAYEGAGGGGFRGGAAGGGKGGADLSSLLAQFLPKKEDETTKNGIMDYRKRSIASEDSSLLDRNANLFERIHNTYQAKQKSRNVGVN